MDRLQKSLVSPIRRYYPNIIYTISLPYLATSAYNDFEMATMRRDGNTSGYKVGVDLNIKFEENVFSCILAIYRNLIHYVHQGSDRHNFTDPLWFEFEKEDVPYLPAFRDCGINVHLRMPYLPDATRLDHIVDDTIHDTLKVAGTGIRVNACLGMEIDDANQYYFDTNRSYNLAGKLRRR